MSTYVFILTRFFIVDVHLGFRWRLVVAIGFPFIHRDCIEVGTVGILLELKIYQET